MYKMLFFLKLFTAPFKDFKNLPTLASSVKKLGSVHLLKGAVHVHLWKGTVLEP